jgi:hypothetical protein
MEDSATLRIKAIVAEVKPLAAEYYRLTGKPLGVTGEIAEYLAAQLLNLELAPARTDGYDAIRHDPLGPVRIQIKGRAFGDEASRSQRMGKIKANAACDIVMLVLMDNTSLDPREIWEAPFSAVATRLSIPGSKSRERGALSTSEFKRMAKRVWPNEAVQIDDSAKPMRKICPECGYEFKGGTWGGLDGHWRSRHEHISPYEDVRSLIFSGHYSQSPRPTTKP